MKTVEQLIEQEEAELLFLQKTRKMLAETQENIACWSVDGNSFYILNQRVFENYILEKFFKHKDFSSFLRQLASYGFHKVQQHQSTVNFGIRLTLGRSYHFEHPMLQQHMSPERILKRRLHKPQDCKFIADDLRNLDLDGIYAAAQEKKKLLQHSPSSIAAAS
jgi:hypothetical protein